MPIILETPHVYDLGHGHDPVGYGLVIIKKQEVDALERVLTLHMKYINVDPETGALDVSPEDAHVIRIGNSEGHQVSGLDPSTGQFAVQTQGAHTNFDDLRESFKVQVVNGDLHASGFDYGVEADGYDLVSDFLYVWLTENGPRGSVADGYAPYYTGTIT